METRSSPHEKLSLVSGPDWAEQAGGARVLSDLLQRAAQQSHQARLVFLDGAGATAKQLTYAEFLIDSERVLAGLNKRGIGAGDVALLQLPRHADFLAALWGCFLGGISPLPLATPVAYSNISSQLQGVRFGWELTRRPLVITDRVTQDQLHAAGTAALGGPPSAVSIDELRAESSGATLRNNGHPDDVALLMLTSGSTAEPKAVVLTHRNLLSAAEASATANHLSSQDINLNWMPLEHIGALAFHIRDVACGASQVHVPTQFVLENPLRWLDLLQQFSATICWAPNFAFGLINDHVSAVKSGEGKWDLHTLRVLLNGSEAIVPGTTQRFLDLLCPYHLSSTCLVPCWGMTETAAAVTYNRQFRRTAVNGEQPQVATGSPIAGVSLRVVDDQGQVVPQGVIGQVQVRGRPVTPGYLHDPAATRDALTDDGWWRTGDCGYLRNGQLTITGREKSQIIIHGVNYSSQAIEVLASKVPGVSQAAAFPVRSPSEDTDSLAVVYCASSTAADPEHIRAEIRREVVRQLGANPRFVMRLNPEDLPRTATGKIKYFELRRRFEAGDFAGLYDRVRSEMTAETMLGVEQQVADAMADALGRGAIGRHDNFFDLGGDSLRAIRVVARLRETLGVAPAMRDLFLAPTVCELARRLDVLRTDPRQVTLSPIRAGNHRQDLPLSPAQQRLWLLDQLDSSNPAYHVSAAVHYGDPSISAFELRGTLDVSALQSGLMTIARRHETLHTEILVSSGCPRQSLRTVTQCPFTYIDLRGEPVSEREAQARQVVMRDHRLAFDLSKGPLWRAGLIQLGPEQFIFYLLLHHLVCDGWSVGILRRELQECYAALRTGKLPQLPQLPVQYVDYAMWYRNMEDSAEFAHQRDYWRHRLRGLTPTRLPPDRSRPSLPSHHGGLRWRVIPAPLAAGIRHLCQARGVTPFVLSLAAFKTFCFRYMGQTDIVIGSPVAHRHWPEVENLIGLFVNTVVLRTSCAGNPRFSELLPRVRDTVLEAFACQDFPFERLVEELQPTRHTGANPLFDIMFAFHNLALEPLRLEALTVTPLAYETTAVRFDSQWDIWELPDGSMRLNVFYRDDLYHSSTVERWLEHYQTLLESVVAEPDQRLSELPLMTKTERDTLLLEFSGASGPSAAIGSVHERFDEQAVRAPKAVALVEDRRQWSYAELRDWSDRIADELSVAGVGIETVVALPGQRSAATIATMLGILKAGGAYLPLDVDQPLSRLHDLMREAGVQLLIADPHIGWPQKGNTEFPCPVLWLRDSANIGDSAPQPRRALDCQLACVMSTSGTTHGPRAVAVEHCGIVRLVKQSNYLEIDPTDVFLQLAPLAFDAATLEIWGPLLNGARLVLPPPDLLSPDEIARLVDRYQVTVLWLTAGMFHVLVQRQLPALRRLRVLLAGGDVLSPGDVQTYFSEPGSADLINGYGPTENTTFTSCHRLAAWNDPHRSVPIGRPVSGTCVYVLDAELNPVPPGVPGELYAGGWGVTRGYLNRPADTAESFVPDPFSRVPGTRLYRSGDLVRWRADGTLEFLGRRDRQLKIQGHRVDPAEIEAALREHQSVREATVLVREMPAGSKQLVAYVASDQQDIAAVLRTRLRARFPETMVPRAIVVVAELPLTPAGKIDQRALPPPQFRPLGLDQNFAEPRTATERKLADIWCALLGLSQVGIHDNFFDLGGESLSAMQLISRMHDEFHVTVPLRCIFSGPTVGELALAITQVVVGECDEELVAKTLEEVEQLGDGGTNTRLPGDTWKE